jgi:CubicO group peptidase (beta-lactamase class C family)
MIRPLLVLLLAPLPALAQAPPLPTVVDRAAKAEVERQKLVGLAVGVIVDGKIRYLQGYGLADREAGVVVDPKATLFRWASCSKPVTAIAALQLAEQGMIDLDADVRTYVPEFPDKQVTITSRNLLCHQGGIVHYTNGKVVRTKKTYDVEHPFTDVICALDTFKESPLVCKPGEKYSYTTHGYILLSAVVQRAGKKPFAEQVAARIAGPLGMTSFQPDYQWKELPNRAAGYLRKGTEISRRPKDEDPDVSWKLGGGGYTSTVEDFAKFAEGLVNRKLVNGKFESEMWRRQKLADGKETTYGLGFGLGRTPGGISWVGHSGSQQKTRTAMLLEPQSRKGVVVMTGSEWANPTQAAAAILDAVAGKSPAPAKTEKSRRPGRE